jgi:hypothetical protein
MRRSERQRRPEMKTTVHASKNPAQGVNGRLERAEVKLKQTERHRLKKPPRQSRKRKKAEQSRHL